MTRFADAGLVGAFVVVGSYGVEIFFVLSGFLIGQLIVKEVLTPPAWPGLRRFWVRRWLRTLPAFYLVLLVRAVAGRPFHWRFLVFLQYFDNSVQSTFPISWSLAVEEWFYLLIPCLLLLAALRAGEASAPVFFGAAAAIAAATLLARAVCVVRWQIPVREHTFLRMDTLMVGVMLGGLRAYARPLYERIARLRGVLGLVGLAGILGTAAWLYAAIRGETVNTSVPLQTVYYDLLAVSIGLCLIALESSERVNRRWAARRWTRPVRLVSLSSYSAYLTHTLAFRPFLGLNAGSTALPRSLLWMACGLALTALATWFLYAFVERPILRLRDRLSGPTAIERAPAVA